MPLFQMAANLTGTDVISKITVSDKSGSVLGEYDYSNTLNDHLPSVVFTMESILDRGSSFNTNDLPRKSQNNLVSNFPGLV